MGKMLSKAHQDDTSAARHYGLLRQLRLVAEAARPLASNNRRLAEALAALDWFEGHCEPRGPRPFEVGESVVRSSDGRRFVVEEIHASQGRPSGFSVKVRDSGILIDRCAWEFVRAIDLKGSA